MQSKNALGNLKNHYLAILKKCNLLNTFGYLVTAGALAASLSFGANMLMPEKAEAFSFSTGDYFTIEQAEEGIAYYSTFTLTDFLKEDALNINYGLLFKNGINSIPTFINPVDLANAMVLQANPNYTIATGSGGLEDFTLNIAGQNLNYTVTAPAISSGRIAALTTDIDNDVFYGLNSTNRGGAIQVTSPNHNLNINGSFIANTAGTQGGAITLWGSNNNTVNGTFIGNHAVDNGGAIYAQAGSNNSISGIFIGNTSETHGGAIANASYGSVIDATFIGNSARSFGGAIFNNSNNSITRIIGTFIANHSSDVKIDDPLTPHLPGGGAIFNGDQAEIASIEASFIGNTANHGGGAISNRGIITTLHGIFMENTAVDAGGAIYNFSATNTADATMSAIDASFINNRTTGANGLGGAIWTNRGLTFQANNRINVFSGNMDSTGYNAIFVEDSNHDIFVSLNFNMLGNGGFVFNDKIQSNGIDFYDVNITGSGSAKSVFALNNNMTEVKKLTVSNANLWLDSVTQDNALYTAKIYTRSATFKSDSMLTLNAQLYTNSAAIISSGGDLTVWGGAKLQLTNMTLHQPVIITNGFADNTSFVLEDAWKEDNLISSFSLYDVSTVSTNPTNYIVIATAKSAEEIKSTYFHMQNTTIEYLQNFTPDYADPLSGRGFFTLLLDSATGLGANQPELVTEVIEKLMQVGSIAGTSSNALNLNSLSADTIQSYRADISNALNNNVVYLEDVRNENQGIAAGSKASSFKKGLAVWGAPFYSNTQINDLKAGAFETSSKSYLGGLSLGADYTFPNKKRIGLAINAGGGSSESEGDLSETSNDFEFIGVSLYGSVFYNNFLFSADIGSTFVRNEVEQAIPSVLGYSDASAKFNSNIFTIGTQATYLLEKQMFDIMPYMGLRYSYIMTGTYDTKMGDSTMVNTTVENQGIFSIPVGLILEKEFQIANNWNIKPSLDLGITFSLGNLETTSTSVVPLTSGYTSYKLQNIDEFTFNGGIGLEAVKSNISFGINYDIQASAHEISHGLQATARYQF